MTYHFPSFRAASFFNTSDSRLFPSALLLEFDSLRLTSRIFSSLEARGLLTSLWRSLQATPLTLDSSWFSDDYICELLRLSSDSSSLSDELPDFSSSACAACFSCYYSALCIIRSTTSISTEFYSSISSRRPSSIAIRSLSDLLLWMTGMTTFSGGDDFTF